jgi:hypothetical protein
MFCPIRGDGDPLLVLSLDYSGCPVRCEFGLVQWQLGCLLVHVDSQNGLCVWRRGFCMCEQRKCLCGGILRN